MSSPPLQIQFGCLFCSSLLAPEAYILSMIGEEFNLWFPFAGRMHLCDFGRSIKDIPWTWVPKMVRGMQYIYIIYIYSQEPIEATHFEWDKSKCKVSAKCKKNIADIFGPFPSLTVFQRQKLHPRTALVDLIVWVPGAQLFRIRDFMTLHLGSKKADLTHD